jgi:hypothetical protein
MAGPAEDLARELAESAERLTKALQAEDALEKSRTNDVGELLRAQRNTTECGEAYTETMRQYIEFFRKVTLE